jgi:hypothetical protein
MSAMFFTATLLYKVTDLSVKVISAVARARSGMSPEQWKQFYVSRLSLKHMIKYIALTRILTSTYANKRHT